MKNHLSLLRRASFCAMIVLASSSFGFNASGSAKTETKERAKHIDWIKLDSASKQDALAMPTVTFKHKLHVQALSKDGKDCSSCHQSKMMGGEKLFNFAYLHSDTLSGNARKDLYHQNCIDCHRDYTKVGKTSGPLEASCRSCHAVEVIADSITKTMDFYSDFHDLHVDAQALQNQDGSSNCLRCHHTGYDAQKNVFIGEEDSGAACSTCHLSFAEKRDALAKDPAAKDSYGPLAERSPLTAAFHSQCVSCHMQMNKVETSKAKNSLPLDCAGCHDPAVYKQDVKPIDPNKSGSLNQLISVRTTLQPQGRTH